MERLYGKNMYAKVLGHSYYVFNYLSIYIDSIFLWSLKNHKNQFISANKLKTDYLYDCKLKPHLRYLYLYNYEKNCYRRLNVILT